MLLPKNLNLTVMKALVAFAQLPLQEQAQQIWDQGCYLLSRSFGRYTCSLYEVDNFFVEVWYNEQRHTITQIIVLDSFIRLDAYIKVVTLRGVFC